MLSPNIPFFKSTSNLKALFIVNMKIYTVHNVLMIKLTKLVFKVIVFSFSLSFTFNLFTQNSIEF